LERLLRDDNVQYTTLAMVWYTHEPVVVALVPFFIFSNFHAVNFVTTTLVKSLYPSVNARDKPLMVRVCERVDKVVKEYYLNAMRFAALWEVAVVMPWVLLLFSL
jgi:hypothetical protein